MKTLKIIDFVGQSFIWVVYVVGSAWLVIADQRWNSLAMTTAYAMLCLGFWQMFSACIMLILKAPERRLRVIHCVAALIYFLILLIAAQLSNSVSVNLGWFGDVLEAAVVTIMVATPIVLAIFYYAITWLMIFSKHATGKFLPHTSF